MINFLNNVLSYKETVHTVLFILFAIEISTKSIIFATLYFLPNVTSFSAYTILRVGATFWSCPKSDSSNTNSEELKT